MRPPLLEVRSLNAFYDRSHVLQGVSFTVTAGEVLTLLGRNGAGKSTTLKAIMGILPGRRGEIVFEGRPIGGLAPHRVARAGIGYVPETRDIFPSLTVEENLTLAARDAGRSGWTRERVYGLFPRLGERADESGANLSGGEQQMLAIARALMTNPRLLLLDEPVEGLAPIVVEQVAEVMRALKGIGLTVLLVEQNLAFVTAFADTVLVLGKGRVRWQGTPDQLGAAHDVKGRWLGV